MGAVRGFAGAQAGSQSAGGDRRARPQNQAHLQLGPADYSSPRDKDQPRPKRDAAGVAGLFALGHRVGDDDDGGLPRRPLRQQVVVDAGALVDADGRLLLLHRVGPQLLGDAGGDAVRRNRSLALPPSGHRCPVPEVPRQARTRHLSPRHRRKCGGGAGPPRDRGCSGAAVLAGRAARQPLPGPSGRPAHMEYDALGSRRRTRLILHT